MWGKLFRTEAVRSVRVDERLRIGEDLLFLLELFHRGDCRTAVAIPGHPYFYDQTGASLMRCGEDKIAQDKLLLEAYLEFAVRHPGFADDKGGEHATFVVRSAWSIAREESREDPSLTRHLRGHFRHSLPHLYGHESRPVFLYLLHPAIGVGWFRMESSFRRWLHRRRAGPAK